MRSVAFERNYIIHPAGSCLASFGRTKVICTASVSEGVPPFLEGTGRGWVTAEYAMLPGSTDGGRKRRDGERRDGRGVEIGRLIGRSLRAAVDLAKLGSITIVIDCDVLQADGGTRTTAISGGWVALMDALASLGVSAEGQVAAVSVGLVNGRVECDLDYEQDRAASVDMNVVMKDDKFIEIQGTAERTPFDRQDLDGMLKAAESAIGEVYRAQRDARLASYRPDGL